MNIAPGSGELPPESLQLQMSNEEGHGDGDRTPEPSHMNNTPEDHPESPHLARMHAPDPDPDSPPARKDTISSTSTTLSTANTRLTATATDSTTGNLNSVEGPVSPTLGQSIFSVKDGAEVASNRRASRRRTGPLSQQQREKAALIRKLGACADCRRRRVACHPNHHGMSWEDAMRKYRSQSPIMQDLAPSLARPLSPAPSHLNHSSRAEAHDSTEMEIDSPPMVPISRAGINRTPLPSGPRLERPSSSTSIMDPIQSDLQSAATRICKSPSRSRYSSVSVLFLYWNNDDEDTIRSVQELAGVLKDSYRYETKIRAIPGTESGNSWRWVATAIHNFMGERDYRDSLKIVFYSGYSYLDANRDMVLASSHDKEQTSTIRWSGIQQTLEEACSDTLVLMDSAYYPSAKTVRQKGVLEFIAAAGSEEHASTLGRCTFTRALSRLFQHRATQMTFSTPYTAAELHAKLTTEYPVVVGNPSPEIETLTSFPIPLHMQVADNTKLPSILLAPIQTPVHKAATGFEPQLTLTFRVPESGINFDHWVEWLKTMPEEVRDVRVDGPTRSTR